MGEGAGVVAAGPAFHGISLNSAQRPRERRVLQLLTQQKVALFRTTTLAPPLRDPREIGAIFPKYLMTLQRCFDFWALTQLSQRERSLRSLLVVRSIAVSRSYDLPVT